MSEGLSSNRLNVSKQEHATAIVPLNNLQKCGNLEDKQAKSNKETAQVGAWTEATKAKIFFKKQGQTTAAKSVIHTLEEQAEAELCGYCWDSDAIHGDDGKNTSTSYYPNKN